MWAAVCRGRASWMWALLLQLLLAGPGGCLRRQDLFPYGPVHGDLELEPGDDRVSPALKLSTALRLFDKSDIHSVYVTTNGLIATSEPPAEEAHPGLFPPNFGAVAPFLADLDTSGGRGKVYYREDASPSVTQLAAEHVQRGFPEVSFQPTSVVVVTWESVAPYQGPSEDPAPEGKRNTFQAVLASSDSSSYAIFLYPEDGLQFTTTFSKKKNSQVPAMVAFSQELLGSLWSSNRVYNIFANDRESIGNLARSSNSGQQGVWMFEIGSPDTANGGLSSDVNLRLDDGGEEYDDEDYDPVTSLGPEDVATTPFPYETPERGDTDTHNLRRVLSPRRLATDRPAGPATERTRSFQLLAERFRQQHPQVIDVDEVEETEVVFSYNTDSRPTCANSRHQCSVHAECRDFATGFCCACVTGYMGNGRQCVAKGSPQRVNGKVKGRIFVGSSPAPVVFENTDLHSYVVTNDGRSYTAISTIPEAVGYSLLPLAPIGGIIGWMFAVEQDGFRNGFSITGGEFTRQAEVTFVGHPGKLVIKQRFSGIDEHGHLTIDTELEGRVPEIAVGSSVHIEPYTELYHYSHNVITSSSAREYTVTEPAQDGAAPANVYTYQWRQTITFQECSHDSARPAPPSTQQLSVDSVFVLYNQEERILRYALSNSIGPVREGSPDALQNPCYIGTHGCDTNAACRPGPGNQFTCECSIGFRGDGRTCYEVEKTRCQLEREHILETAGVTGPQHPLPLGLFVPECDEYGNYVPTQCHGSTGYCWCVDRDGRELEGTRTRMRPPCLSTVAPPIHQRPLVPPTVIPLPPGTHLLFAQTGKIERLPLEGSTMRKTDAKTLLHAPDKVIIGLAFDCVDKMVYWTDISEPSIGRASLLGGEPTTIIRQDLGSPEGIALDHLGRNLFWTDSRLDRIEVAKLDGTQRRVLFETDLVNPRGIVTDSVRGNLYWTDWNRDNPKIETSYMDGTNRRVLVHEDLGLPNGLTFDAYSSQLCWVDAGTSRAECLQPGQSSRRRVLEGLQYPFSVTSFGKNLYYTDWKTNSVIAVDLAVSKETDAFHPHKQARLYGITTALPQCPQGHNYCAVNNGGCTHLCLATPGGRTCRCPDNTLGVDCIEHK
ncbi:nidogen 1 [Phyllostomus discolor]|uniref:Nidogen 1 n=1 Tax=Phyllostomus discolor TaxID=89673 RepID=A0A833Y8E0_9CHIR|nr:nidogen 1 [Phyllostomus discolor]